MGCLIWAAVCTIITNCYEEQVYDDEGVVVVSTTSSSDDDVTSMNECMRTYVYVVLVGRQTISQFSFGYKN